MPDSLIRHPDFLRLWAGQTVSRLGSNITRNALPLAALLALGAGPVQMGLLAAIGAAPILLVGLFAGVWVDRVQRRPLMIAADLGRAVVIGTIPLAAALGILRLEHLYLVALLAGVLTVIFDVAYPSYLPGLVGSQAVLEANSKMELSSAIVEITGPGLAGALVQALTAPFAILFDALSFLVSAVSLGSIRFVESSQPPTARRGLAREALEGLGMVAGHPLLRALAGASGTLGFFGNFIGTLYALYAVRTLGLSPVLLGITIGVGGAGELIGALLARRVVERYGLGRVLISSALVASLLALIIPLARGPQLAAAAILMVSQLVQDTAFAIYFINELSLRQSVVPARLLGRANATNHVLVAGIAPLGALLGGALGGWIGLRPTLVVAALGMAFSAAWLWFSPVHGLPTFPVGDKVP